MEGCTSRLPGPAFNLVPNDRAFEAELHWLRKLKLLALVTESQRKMKHGRDCTTNSIKNESPLQDAENARAPVFYPEAPRWLRRDTGQTGGGLEGTWSFSEKVP